MKKNLIIAFFIVMHALNSSATKNNLDKKVKDFDDIVFNWSGTFAEVLGIAGKKHYEIPNPEKCMIHSINTFLHCLDPHSSFLDPKTYKSILEKTSGQFFGIGIVINSTRSTKDKFLHVINTVSGGPADKAGIKQYDKIIEIEGKQLEGMTTEEATSKLRGDKNTKVHIKIIREKEKAPLSFDIVRDVIKEPSSLAFYIKQHNIYYVSLATFSKNSVKQIRNILEKSNEKKYKGIILDLRNNSGGLLSAVIDIAGLFLKKDSLIVITKDRNNKKITEYKTKHQPVTNINIPIFILVNNYTASASEILAGGLKIHSKQQTKKSHTKDQNLMVFIVGTNTFGKGSVQEIIPLENNCAIKLTTSLYFLPDNTTIQGTGIEPDFLVQRLFPPSEKVAWFLEHYGREKSLKHSIKPNKEEKEKENEKKERKKEPKSWEERVKDTLSKDNQFLETIKLINLLDICKQKFPESCNNRDDAVKFIIDTFGLNKTVELETIKI